MPENSFTLPSFAKINLLLRVLGKRADGFHEISMVLQTISLCDYLTFTEYGEMCFTCDNENIPVDNQNLVVKAAQLLGKKYDIKKGAKIHLEKRIPAPGGLGGGSSNAATALIGLVQLWDIEINFEELCDIGAELGSDVPFFFYGGTAAGTGRGTEIFHLDDFTQNHLLIVTPKIDVSTSKAFALLDMPDLTNKDSKSILPICRDEVNSLYLHQSELKNDFEPMIFEIEPEIARVKEKLFDYGANSALMSGSGASVFAFFDTDKRLRAALNDLQSERGWRVFPAETISRRIYKKSLGLEKILLNKN